MNNLLYYPYINVPRIDWTLRILLYYDNIGTIVPQEYFHNPENIDPFMLELIRNQLVTPINPMEVFDDPWQAKKPFIQLIEKNAIRLKKTQDSIRNRNGDLIHGAKFIGSKIHADKFDENIFYGLQELGLAEKGEGCWYVVEKRTAYNLKKFLATVISVKTQRTPITDFIRATYNRSPSHIIHRKRETILANLIPFPEDIDLNKLTKFKERHSQLLSTFRTRVELIALDPNLIEGTQVFNQHLSELVQRKDELTAKMNESKFNNILYGTVCGIIGASVGIAGPHTTLGLVSALPGFANAVHSALQIERAENIFDQSGLKYLALAEKD